MINLVSAIYNELEFKRDEEKRDRSLSHYPSGVCAIVNNKHIGQCKRQLWYSMKNIEKSDPIDAYSLLKIDMGNMIHDKLDIIIGKALKRMDDIKKIDGEEIEVKWKEDDMELPFSGRIDYGFISKDERVAIEWKSTYGSGITRIKNEGISIDRLLQPICYLHQKVYPIDSIYLMYLGRDNGYIYGFRITQQDTELRVEHLNSNKVQAFDINFDNIKEALLIVEENFKSQSPPSRDYNSMITSNGTLSNKSDWQCRYCSYKSKCWELI